MARELLRKLAWGSAVTGIIRILAVLLTFVFFVAASHSMNTVDFGAFSMLYSAATLFSYAANLGQHVAVLRFWPTLDVAHGRPTAGKYLGLGLLMVIGGSLAFGLAGLIISVIVADNPIVGFTSSDFAWTGALVMAAALAEFAASAMRAQGAVVSALAPRDIVWRLVAIVAIAVMSVPQTTTQMVMITTFSLLVVCMPQLLVLSAEALRYRTGRLPRHEWLKIRHATPGLWAATSVAPGVDQGMTILVGIVLGPMAAGAYFAADRLARFLSFGLVALEQVAGPIIARSLHGGNLRDAHVVTAVVAIGATLFATLGTLGFAVAGRQLLALFGEEFAEFWPALIVLAAGHLASTACGANAILLLVAGAERKLLGIRSAWALIAVVLVPVGAILSGVFGASIASAVVLAGWNITAAYACRKTVGVSADIIAGLSILRSQSRS